MEFRYSETTKEVMSTFELTKSVRASMLKTFKEQKNLYVTFKTYEKLKKDLDSKFEYTMKNAEKGYILTLVGEKDETRNNSKQGNEKAKPIR